MYYYCATSSRLKSLAYTSSSFLHCYTRVTLKRPPLSYNVQAVPQMKNEQGGPRWAGRRPRMNRGVLVCTMGDHKHGMKGGVGWCLPSAPRRKSEPCLQRMSPRSLASYATTGSLGEDAHRVKSLVAVQVNRPQRWPSHLSKVLDWEAAARSTRSRSLQMNPDCVFHRSTPAIAGEHLRAWSRQPRRDP